MQYYPECEATHQSSFLHTRQVLGENGIIMVHSGRRLGWGHVCHATDCVTSQNRRGPDWQQGSSSMRKAVQYLACGEASLMCAAVGDMDG